MKKILKTLRTFLNIDLSWAWKNLRIRAGYFAAKLLRKNYLIAEVNGTPIKLGFISPKHFQIAKKIKERQHEHELVEWWAKEAKDHKLIYDLGGYNGLFGISAALANPKAKVVIFEPDPECCRQIEENIKLNGGNNCVLKRVAVGERDATTCFSQSGPAAHVSPAGREVTMVRLDSLAPADLIKMDIEGVEAGAFRGGKNVLRSRPVMLLEDHYNYMPRYGDSEEVLFDLVDKLGYKKKYLREDQYSRHYLLTS